MKYRLAVKQFLRFGTIGVLNTAVDFLLLNGLILTFGLTKNDPRFTIFKIISFTAAVINSFLWNKYWVFKENETKKDSSDTRKEMVQFLGISLIGLVIDISIASVVYHAGNALFPGTSASVWANVGALAGTVIVLMSNFAGYKFIVFKK